MPNTARGRVPRTSRDATLARMLIRALLILLLLYLASRFSGYPTIPRPRPPQVSPPWLTTAPMKSVLVFAPHSDDETLACAGVIMHALAQGSKVRVVLMTNGDGFPAAAEEKAPGRSLATERFISLGYTRQGETLAALAALGLDPEDVTFLGYPDHGISQLWLNNWDYSNLYTSRYTKSDASPYSNSFTPRAPYCGLSVVDDIARIIEESAPSHIFIPHPNDSHADHWGTFALVSYVLARRSILPGPAPRPEILAYVVHRGDWPLPRGFHPGWPLDPPRPIVRRPKEWVYAPMTPHETEAKRKAIEQYKSQITIMRLYMLSFVRRNEVFDMLACPIVSALPDSARSSEVRNRFWHTSVPVVRDALDDTLTRVIGSSGDLKAIHAAHDDESLYLWIKPRGNASRMLRYSVNLCDFGSPRTMINISSGPGMVLRATANSSPIYCQSRQSAGGLEITIPLSVLRTNGDEDSPQAVFFSVQAQVGPVVVDKTGWTVLRMSPDQPDIFH